MIREPVGHEAQRSVLAKAASGTSLHHAWLFSGPAGTGKMQVARWWASLLKCETGGSCNPLCESCRLIAGGVHPDVLEMRPPPKDKNAEQSVDDEIERKESFGIDESRSLIQRISLRATRPGPRIAIVREANRMTPPAQNGLLKILEEPPGSAVIVLIAENAGGMLATIRSRCRQLTFGALSQSEVVAVLKSLGWTTEDATAAAAYSRGSVSRALDYDAKGVASREQLLLEWERSRKDPAAIEPVVSALLARKQDGYALELLLEWQLAKVQRSLGHEVHEPSAQLARLLADSSEDTLTLLSDAERIQRTISMLARNANARLVIRDMLLNVEA